VEGLTAAKRVGAREETAASQSRGYRWGSSGWGGSTRRRGAWGEVKMVGGGLVQAVRDGSVRPERNDDGGAKEQP
jgi:hypothetical protein